MSDKPLSEELREWIGDVPGAEKLEGWAERAAALEADYEQLRPARDQLRVLEDTLRVVEPELERLQAGVAELNANALRDCATFASLTYKLRAAEARCAELEAELLESKEKRSEARRTIAEFSTKLCAAKAELERVYEERTAAEAKASNYCIDKERAEDKLQVAEAARDRLKQALDEADPLRAASDRLGRVNDQKLFELDVAECKAERDALAAEFNKQRLAYIHDIQATSEYDAECRRLRVAFDESDGLLDSFLCSCCDSNQRTWQRLRDALKGEP